ncbi:hypothetical protein EJ05DRAFT_62988 [Pseudovirgaria hyperparasitica]|uniref:Uncharacterized protein n=1 Tax=Pseudovirgaria hyperparasitica TaxID=470096 RepID=A0A6A6W1D5_9PEZI|nr:uncharacterized protein EJ05DRAFT_62988 [Pseudovirgaria hyperparasitica]KAF2756353.1 hypothetical protein EJ05DRAFT_62988 [Pseudovirgaria hyperparasitica]
MRCPRPSLLWVGRSSICAIVTGYPLCPSIQPLLPFFFFTSLLFPTRSPPSFPPSSIFNHSKTSHCSQLFQVNRGSVYRSLTSPPPLGSQHRRADHHVGQVKFQHPPLSLPEPRIFPIMSVIAAIITSDASRRRLFCRRICVNVMSTSVLLCCESDLFL